MGINFSFNESKFDEALQAFQEYSKGERALNDKSQRAERIKFYQSVADEEFNQFNFEEAIKKLWASLVWGNKEYLVNNIKKNGMDKIEREFKLLVSHKGTPGERYERFIEEIKYMGPSMVTELLCYTDPQNAGIWNDIARKALRWLEVKDIPCDKYKLNGKEYDQYNSLLKFMAQRLTNAGHKNVDMLYVDYFLWEVWDQFARGSKIRAEAKPATIKKIEPLSKSKHNELRDEVAQIGSWLGFETETEVQIAAGSRIDTIWKARIANLGMVSYVFEVQVGGSVDSLILNLQKAQRNPTVQKLIIVSDSEQLQKISREIGAMPESFRNAVKYWDAEEVEETHESLEQVTNSIAKLNLVED